MRRRTRPGPVSTPSSGTGTLTIDKRLATWTTNPASKTYGDADPVPLTTGSGTNFLAADNVTATYTRVAGENASPPTYHITATLSATPLSALDNYIITNDGAEFTINKRLATWTTNPASKTYGDPDPVPLTTGSGSNFVAADNVTATYSRVAGENASPPTVSHHGDAECDAAGGARQLHHHERRRGVHDQQAPGDVDDEPGQQDLRRSRPESVDDRQRQQLRGRRQRDGDLQPRGGREREPADVSHHRDAERDAAGALDNYIITNDGAEFTINKRLATWTTNPASKTYGDADPVR